MAGKGQRFVGSVYNKPKPFIDVCGKSMIERVMDNLLPNSQKHSKYTFIIIVNQDLVKNYAKELDDIKILYGRVEILVDSTPSGPAGTCLVAKHLINNEDPLLIANCDQIVGEDGWLDGFIDYNVNADGLILCVLAKEKKWSFVDIADDTKKITRCIEKNPISPIATTGHYFFRKGSSFVRAAEEAMTNGIKTNGEYYVSGVIDTMIQHGQLFFPYMVNRFYPIGIPEDLEKYISILKSHY